MKVKLGSSIEDILSRALDPPSSINVQRAVSALVEVRALTATEEITPMGRLLSKLPTDVHLGKFLLTATVFQCLDPALTIAATLNSKSPFLTPFGKEDEAHWKKLSFRTGQLAIPGTDVAHKSVAENSDFLTLHNAFSAWRRACANGTSAERKFCRESYLSHQVTETFRSCAITENASASVESSADRGAKTTILGVCITCLRNINSAQRDCDRYLIDSSFISVDSNIVRELNRYALLLHMVHQVTHRVLEQSALWWERPCSFRHSSSRIRREFCESCHRQCCTRCRVVPQATRRDTLKGWERQACYHHEQPSGFIPSFIRELWEKTSRLRSQLFELFHYHVSVNLSTNDGFLNSRQAIQEDVCMGNRTSRRSRTGLVMWGS